MADPSIPPPPPPPAKKKRQQNAFQTWMNMHPGWKQYAANIQTWAASNGHLDPLGFAIALSIKYGDHPTGLTVQGAFQPDSLSLSQYVNNLGWDQGFTNWIGSTKYTMTKLVPKGYTLRGGATPASEANTAAANAQAKIPTTDPYVYVDKDGNVKKWGGTTPPSFTKPGKTVVGTPGSPEYSVAPAPKGNTPLTHFGQPLQWSQYLQAKQYYDGIFLAFTGKRATPTQIQHILASGMTDFQLTNQLSQTPAFLRSPTWKQKAPAYTAAARKIYGNQFNANDPQVRNLMRNAIANNLSPEVFQDQLRHLPTYVNTAEFKTNSASFATVYQRIYGNNDPNMGVIVKEATLAGWSPEQFTNYLRSLPQYTASGEYLYKQTALADALGLITGQQTTLTQGEPNVSNNAPRQKLPNSPFVSGDPNAVAPQTAGLG